MGKKATFIPCSILLSRASHSAIEWGIWFQFFFFSSSSQWPGSTFSFLPLLYLVDVIVKLLTDFILMMQTIAARYRYLQSGWFLSFFQKIKIDMYVKKGPTLKLH